MNTSQVAHQVGAYLGVLSILSKITEISVGSQMEGSFFRTWMDRGIVRVKCLAQEIQRCQPDRSIQSPAN